MLPGISTFPMPISSGVPPVLDIYGSADFAMAMWKLRTDYSGSCLRIRRSNDNAETDIDFTSLGVVDTAAISSHCGSNNGFVSKWYDQSGNANDFTTSTAAEQPKIHDATTGVLSDANGNIAIYADGSGNILRSTNANNFNAGATFMALIVIQGAVSDKCHLLGSGSASDGFLERYGHGLVLTETDAHAMLKCYSDAGMRIEGADNLTNTTTTQIIMGNAKPNDSEIWVNGVSVATDSGGIGSFNGYEGNVSLFASCGGNTTSDIDEFEGYCCCAIGWISDQGANATGIHDNIAANVS